MNAPRTLTIFDFDDTLVWSHGSRVRITHSDGTMSDLSTEDYANYVHRPDDEYDFSDFDRYPHGAELIDTSVHEIMGAMSQGHEVIVLTARKSSEPVRQFLHDHGISGIEIVAVGGTNPMKKASFVVDKIKGSDFDLVQVYEDSMNNIRAIRKVVDEYGIRFKSVRVTSDGSHVVLERRRRLAVGLLMT